MYKLKNFLLGGIQAVPHSEVFLRPLEVEGGITAQITRVRPQLHLIVLGLDIGHTFRRMFLYDFPDTTDSADSGFCIPFR